jgi:hypothetical protein
MQLKNNAAVAAEDLERYFNTGNFAHVANLEQLTNVAELVLEELPSGDFAWLKPCTEPSEPDDALYWPTESGRDLVARVRAQEALFSYPWPTVAEVTC